MVRTCRVELCHGGLTSNHSASDISIDRKFLWPPEGLNAAPGGTCGPHVVCPVVPLRKYSYISLPQDGNGDGSGDGTRAVAEMGTGTGSRAGSGKAEERRRSARNRTRVECFND